MKGIMIFVIGAGLGFICGKLYTEHKIEKEWEEEDRYYKAQKKKKEKEKKSKEEKNIEPEEQDEPVEEVNPPREETDDDDEKDIVEDAKEIKKTNRNPKIISKHDANFLPEDIEDEVVFWYTDDNVLVDEDDHELIEEDTLGNALVKFGFKDNDEEKLLYVMNYKLNTCFEVHKMFGTFDPEKIET